MFHKTIADYVAAAGLCLLALAAIDGAIEMFESATSITLWKTCGVIGIMLVLANLAMEAFVQDSTLRRGIRRLSVWNRLRIRKRQNVQGEVHLGDDASLSAAR